MTAGIAEDLGVIGSVGRARRSANAGRTVATLAGLTLTLPIDLLLIAVVAAIGRVRRGAGSAEALPASEGRTVLITGGKMTKALQLARSFHRAGHRVVLTESAKYRFTGHRFSRAVDAFHCLPGCTAPDYADALLDIVDREGIDVFVPVSSPAASVPDARAGQRLGGVGEVLHADADVVAMLDDKAAFSKTAEAFGLRVPDWRHITDARQVENFDFPDGRSYILKRITYNPVGRLEMALLAGQTPQHNSAVARSLPITQDDPWILQEYIAGREYCTHGTVRNGRLQVYVCCESSASQLNYAVADKPEIRRWVERFVGALGVTGQLSFDFIEAADGQVYAIECNPRTHSAITLFHNHFELASAYLQDDHPAVTPLPDTRPTYWIYHEVWRLFTQPGRGARLAGIVRGKDAILTWWDPLPYLMVHHLQIPALLIGNLVRRRGWVKIDFNIGKLVEPGGD
jgi:predicted ATP-grasp superfamily ATP-dependent carboligase